MNEASLALVRLVLLLAACLWAFWPQVCHWLSQSLQHDDWAHTLVAPLLILLLVLRRWKLLRAALSPGSYCGAFLIAAGLLTVAFFTWPISYGYARDLGLVPVLAGIVLATCGARVLKLCLPLLLLAALSLPIGPRATARLIIGPETYTLKAAELVLNGLPGVTVRATGPDLDFTRAPDRKGTIALGQPHAAASVLPACLIVGVFVTFASIRPTMQVIVLGLLAGPITLLCNFVRILCWGVIDIYCAPDPTSSWPRPLSACVALLFAYVLFRAVAGLIRFLSEESPVEEPAVPARTEGAVP